MFESNNEFLLSFIFFETLAKKILEVDHLHFRLKNYD